MVALTYHCPEDVSEQWCVQNTVAPFINGPQRTEWCITQCVRLIKPCGDLHLTRICPHRLKQRRRFNKSPFKTRVRPQHQRSHNMSLRA